VHVLYAILCRDDIVGGEFLDVVNSRFRAATLPRSDPSMHRTYRMRGFLSVAEVSARSLLASQPYNLHSPTAIDCVRESWRLNAGNTEYPAGSIMEDVTDLPMPNNRAHASVPEKPTGIGLILVLLFSDHLVRDAAETASGISAEMAVAGPWGN
jgi:hypothetical protein